jgi:hypothetical protein
VCKSGAGVGSGRKRLHGRRSAQIFLTHETSTQISRGRVFDLRVGIAHTLERALLALPTMSHTTTDVRVPWSKTAVTAHPATISLSKIVMLLSGVIAVLGSVAASLGLWLTGGDGPHAMFNARGGLVRLYGQGLYRDDSVMIGAGFQGQDAVTLFIAVPLLLATVWQFVRDHAKGGLLLSGVLTYFLYVYASMAFGAAYNRLFLLYVALLSASFFALVLVLFAVRATATLAIECATKLPRRAMFVFFSAAGLITFAVWTVPIAVSLLEGRPPAFLDHYTTPVTYALDLGLIVPGCFLVARLIVRGRSFGYVLAFPFLGLIILLAPAIALATWWQRTAGISFTVAEMIGPVSGFLVLGAVALWLSASVWRRLPVLPL